MFSSVAVLRSPDSVYDGFQSFGLTLYQGYGMTETAPVLSVNPYLKSKRGSVGPAVEGVERSRLKIQTATASGKLSLRDRVQ